MNQPIERLTSTAMEELIIIIGEAEFSRYRSLYAKMDPKRFYGRIFLKAWLLKIQPSGALYVSAIDRKLEDVERSRSSPSAKTFGGIQNRIHFGVTLNFWH